MHRFIIPHFEFLPILSDKPIVHQIVKVLKLRIGETVVIGNGFGEEAAGEIVAIDKNQIELKFGEIVKNNRESTRRVVLYCAILKRENFELVVQKATEIGVAAIVPIVSGYTVKTNLNLPRLKKIINEAVEQSGRGVVPEISAPQTFDMAMKNIDSQAVNWFCDTGTDLSTMSVDPSVKNINVFVGPEGGWSAEEIRKAHSVGLSSMSLGKTILRGETAAIVAAYLAVNK